ncbi:tyrosine-type recombinase/integrase [Streptomyces sp. NBC_01244]|uniref:tyrosine-type recombinase/integrase n=1 Tax=Streptomyces sp. NBC_01244 TaxID=2903797 RepID=UPI002E139619|nr:site-specific integrase [Streptomyces sp. NBC_01244]
MGEGELAIITRGGGQLTVPAGPRAEESFLAARTRLGSVRPRDARTRRLGEPRYRMDLLTELCDEETAVEVMHWLTNTRIGSDQSARDYADDLRHWAAVVREELGLFPMSFRDISPELVRVWRLSEESRVRADGSRRISDRTILRRLSTVSSLYAYARWRTGDKTIISPVAKFDRPQIDPKDESTATPILEKEELQELISAARTAREAFVPATIYTFAGRVTECCTTRLEKIEQRGGRRHLDVLRKRSKGRMWGVPDGLEQLADVVLAGRSSGALMLDDQGREMDRHAVNDLLARLGKRAGVMEGRDVTAHVLRASCLTHKHDEGTSLEDIQEFADHVHIETTRRYIRRRMDQVARLAHADEAMATVLPAVARWLPEAA